VAASEHAKPKRMKRVKLPKLSAEETVPEALKSLRKAHLKPAVVPGTSYPKAKPGKHFVAGEWDVKITHHVKKHGKTVPKVTYEPIKTGALEPVHATIWVRPKLVANHTESPQPPQEKPLVTTGDTDLPEKIPPLTGPIVTDEQKPVIQLPTPDTTPPQTGPVETTPHPGETAPPFDMNVEREKDAKANTAYLPFLNGCSGRVIRNPQGIATGVVSAYHCSMYPDVAPRESGSDGQLYTIMNTPSLDVLVGDDVSSLSRIGTVEQVILPAAADTSHDLIIFTFEGHSPAEVRADFEASRVPESQVRNMTVGTTLHISGYPQIQPNNHTGITRRELMTLTTLGIADVYTNTNRVIPTLWTGLNASNTKDGVVCSPGESGAVATTEMTVKNADGTQKAVFKMVGVDSAYDDFRLTGNTIGYDAAAILKERIAFTGFKNLAKYDSTCDLSFQTPDPGNSDIVRLVKSSSQIPRALAVKSAVVATTATPAAIGAAVQAQPADPQPQPAATAVPMVDTPSDG
jgi:hypothetical protein